MICIRFFHDMENSDLIPQFIRLVHLNALTICIRPGKIQSLSVPLQELIL